MSQEQAFPRVWAWRERDPSGRAWAIKESLREFWRKPTREQALAHWKLWYRWATHSRLKPVIKTAIFFHCGGLRLYPVTHAKPG